MQTLPTLPKAILPPPSLMHDTVSDGRCSIPKLVGQLEVIRKSRKVLTRTHRCGCRGKGQTESHFCRF